MSRSYKKNPVLKDGSRGRRRSGKISMKAIANRKIRRKPIEELPMREKGAYRKVCESWDISDWSFRQSKEEAIKQYIKKKLRAAPGMRNVFSIVMFQKQANLKNTFIPHLLITMQLK